MYEQINVKTTWQVPTEHEAQLYRAMIATSAQQMDAMFGLGGAQYVADLANDPLAFVYRMGIQQDPATAARQWATDPDAKSSRPLFPVKHRWWTRLAWWWRARKWKRKYGHLPL